MLRMHFCMIFCKMYSWHNHLVLYYSHPLFVSILHKSLYGLKQAPHAWNDRFTPFLITLGFHHTYYDSSLFVKTLVAGIIDLLVYVDDIIITGSDPVSFGRLYNLLQLNLR